MDVRFIEWPSEEELESLWVRPATTSYGGEIKVCGAVLEDGSGVVVFGRATNIHSDLLAEALERELGIRLFLRRAPGVVQVGGGKFTFGISKQKGRQVWAQDLGWSETLGGGMPEALEQPAKEYVIRRVGRLADIVDK